MIFSRGEGAGRWDMSQDMTIGGGNKSDQHSRDVGYVPIIYQFHRVVGAVSL